jgi:hypothetical protein
MREAGLTRTLEGIARQRVPSRDFSEIRVVVVDNDCGGSAKPVCDRLSTSYPWSLEYALEPMVGIPYARNRALDIVTPADDLLAFLDDDEVPSETWLAELLRVWREYSADIVFGPVEPYFPEPVPRWIERGAFFARNTHPTGTACMEGGTGNVLMTTHMLRHSGLRFDETCPLSGGSDTLFFRGACQARYRMIWADEALVTEWIPRSRATLNWLTMRHFRCGATEFHGPGRSVWRRLRGAALGMARFVFGACCTVVFSPFGRHRSVKALRWASYGLGLVCGAAGLRFEEYRTVRSV